MRNFTVCLEMTVTRIYNVEALGDIHAVEKAKLLAEQEPDVVEVAGGSAEEAEPWAA